MAVLRARNARKYHSELLFSTASTRSLWHSLTFLPRSTAILKQARYSSLVTFILLKIIFHALMERFQLELIYCFTFIFHRRPLCPSQETEVTSTLTRPVENVVLTTKDLQDRNTNIIAGTTVENKGKLITRAFK